MRGSRIKKRQFERRRILHLLDRSDGGVPHAVADYIENSPDEFEHYVLAPNGNYPARLTRTTATITHFVPGPIATTRAIRSAVASIRPDVVHAHSSFPGLRIRLMRSRGYRVVYSPHCFAFLRTDVGRVRRGLFLLAEKALARRTDIIAACGSGEMAMAMRLMRGAPGTSVLVPNVSSLRRNGGRPQSPAAGLRIGMSGRISPQKDPSYFISVLRTIRQSGIAVIPVWIGDGDPRLRESLASAGVDVSGWATSTSLLADRMAALDLYVHSAAWEGFPLAVLDAARVGVPILVRDIKAFAGIPSELTVEHGVSSAIDACADPQTWSDWQDSNRRMWSNYLSRHQIKDQREALALVWSAE